MIAWFYGAPLWLQKFLIEDAVDLSTDWSIAQIAALWGFEFFLSLVAGGGLAYFLSSSHPLRWTAAFGSVLCVAHWAFSRPEVLDASHWSDYAMHVAGILVPLVGAVFGGIVASSLIVRKSGDAAV